jgi:hypothetical protein
MKYTGWERPKNKPLEALAGHAYDAESIRRYTRFKEKSYNKRCQAERFFGLIKLESEEPPRVSVRQKRPDPFFKG